MWIPVHTVNSHAPFYIFLLRLFFYDQYEIFREKLPLNILFWIVFTYTIHIKYYNWHKHQQQKIRTYSIKVHYCDIYQLHWLTVFWTPSLYQFHHKWCASLEKSKNLLTYYFKWVENNHYPRMIQSAEVVTWRLKVLRNISDHSWHVSPLFYVSAISFITTTVHAHTFLQTFDILSA